MSQVRCSLSWKVQMIVKNPSKNSQQNPQPNSHGHVQEIFTDFFCRVGRLKKAHKHKEMGPQSWTLDPTPKTPLDPPPSKFFMHCILLGKTNTYIKNLGAKAPSLTPWPGSLRNSLCRFSLGVFSVRDHPNFEKNALRIWAEILASNQFRESLRELLREEGFHIN